ncbi:MAG: hypothetical protein HY334_02595 [Armatimonadetes bacterium]|nr:hypothetical protein [Armatimonadota bacterium]
MCAVGSAVDGKRPVWTNDREFFPFLVARVMLNAAAPPPPPCQAEQLLQANFTRNHAALLSRFRKYILAEERYLLTPTLSDAETANRVRYTGTDPALDRERVRLAKHPRTFPYRLATITYPGSYFGVRQCIEIDSIRYAIDAAYAARHIGQEERLWLVVALGRVLVRVNNSTGHFAQYLKPNEHNLKRLVAKRRRSVWNEFLTTLKSVSPVGTQQWRLTNRSFHSDALVLLSRLALQSQWPRTIYADPPYSRAQYSRYYHVLNVIAAYRYPAVFGNGRYPNDRFQTPFAHAAAVERVLDTLIQRTSYLGSALLLSYPDNGLLHERGGSIYALLRRHYPSVEVLDTHSLHHSTLGASRGRATVTVRERLYLALP